MTRRFLLLVPGLLAAVLCIGMLTSAASAKPGVVVTRQGQRISGEITEKDDQVVVTNHGVDTILQRDDIASIDYSEGFNKEFHDRWSQLDPRDVKGRVELARWALSQKQYNAAHDVLDQAQQIDPNSREVYDMQILVRSQARLDAQARAQNNPAPTTARGAAGGGNGPASRSAELPPVPPTPPNQPERRFLSPADINRIKQAELRLSDAGVGIQFLNQVERRYCQYAGRQFSQFNALKPVNRAVEILDKGDPSMRADVRINGDPGSLMEYRTRVQPVILNGCAAANCHGSTKAGHLTLFVPAGDTAPAYTNFYILTQYQKTVETNESGPFGGPTERKLIERTQGQRSLLAQYMLPADQSDLDHPVVPGYNGVVRSRNDPKWQQIVDWMNRSLVPVAPDYQVTYDIPNAPPPPPASGPAPTSRPAASNRARAGR